MNLTLMVVSGLVLIVVVLMFKMRGWGKSAGRYEQRDKDGKKLNGYIRKFAPILYRGDAGTDSYRVRKPGRWGKGS